MVEVPEIIDAPTYLSGSYGDVGGLPLGCTEVLWGSPLSGKGPYADAMIAQMQKGFADGIALTFDSEMRGRSAQREEARGIDSVRHIVVGVNRFDEMLEFLEGPTAALCRDGMPLKLVVINSLTSLRASKSSPLTLQEGLRRLFAIQREHKFALIITLHVRSGGGPGVSTLDSFVELVTSLGLQDVEFLKFFERQAAPGQARKKIWVKAMGRTWAIPGCENT